MDLLNLIAAITGFLGIGVVILGAIRRSEKRTGDRMGELETRLITRIDGVETRLTARMDRMETRIEKLDDRVYLLASRLGPVLEQAEATSRRPSRAKSGSA